MSILCKRWRRAGGNAAVVVACLAGVLTAPLLAGAAYGQSAAAGAPAGQTVALDALAGQWPTLTGAQQVSVLQQLVMTGQIGLAEQLLADPATAQSIAPDDVAFFRGMIAKLQQRPRRAAEYFRTVLADNPEHRRARLELGHALALSQDDDNARHHLQLAMAGADGGDAAGHPGAAAPDAAIANIARRLIAEIDGRSRLSVSSNFRLAPSSNVNQGTSEEVVVLNGLPFTIAKDSQAQSGVGAVSGLSASYRIALGNSVDLVPTVSADQKLYSESELNELQVTTALGPRVNFDGGYVGLFATAGQRWVQDDAYAFSWGGRLQGAVRLNDQTNVSASLSCEQRQHDSSWKGTDLSYQDGIACLASVQTDYYLNTASYIRLIGGLEHEVAETEHLSFDGVRGGVGLFRELPWGMTVYGQALYSERWYDGLAPGTTLAREDQRLDLSVTLTKRDFAVFGFAPSLEYSYRQNDSNVDLHDFDAHGVIVTVTRSF